MYSDEKLSERLNKPNDSVLPQKRLRCQNYPQQTKKARYSSRLKKTLTNSKIFINIFLENNMKHWSGKYNIFEKDERESHA